MQKDCNHENDRTIPLLELDSVTQNKEWDFARRVTLIFFRSLKDVKEELETGRAQNHNDMAHPVNALHVIRRFVTAWQDIFQQVGNFTNYNGERQGRTSDRVQIRQFKILKQKESPIKATLGVSDFLVCGPNPPERTLT